MATRYEDIWHEHVSESRVREIQGNTGYSEREILQAHLAIVEEYMEGESRMQKYIVWEDYVKVMVANDHSMSHENFLRYVLGVEVSDFDWEAWREAMGYGRH